MKMTEVNEAELIERYKNGDRKSLEILISSNYDKLKGYIFKLTCDIHLTEDILQDTLLAAIYNIDSFEPRAKFSTWLIKIASNKYKDYLRKHRDTEDILESIPSLHSVEEYVIEKDNIQRLLEILKSLSVDKRNVFILKHYYGYTYAEIAVITGCSIGTVRSRLHYAIKDILSKFKEGK